MFLQQDPTGSSTSASQDAPQTVDVDPGAMLERVDAWVDGAVKLVPNLLAALVVATIFWFVAKFAQRLVKKSAHGRDRDNLGQVLGGFVRWLVFGAGLMLAATVVVPSLEPGDLIAGLGVSSVAIGFAFKDILQNWLAGMLILIRQPFEVGDQIKVEGSEGTVERIETRATILRTYDGQRVVIPNSDVYTNSVLVRTAYEKRRSEYDVGIGYGDGIDEACRVIREAVERCEGVASDPGVEALPWDLAASWVTIRARWWTESPRADQVHTRARVIQAIKEALDEARIDMPYETRVQLLHDQTEETDGDRSAQREGWPTTEEGSTRPRWRAELEAGRSSEAEQGEDQDSNARNGSTNGAAGGSSRFGA